jgi:hypothetical protein
MTKPKPGTKLLPLGTSIFVSVFVSFDSDAVGDDCIFVTCISTGAVTGVSIIGVAGTSIVLIGLIGLIGLFTFIGLLVVI